MSGGGSLMLKEIVLVEDDDVIRENYAELLSDEGFFGRKAIVWILLGLIWT